MTFYAQAEQDAWVLGLHPTPGYFVDVGAHDGVVHSNTKALEEAGWQGLCIEPNREAYETLTENRACRTLPIAASNASSFAAFDGVRVGQGDGEVVTAPLRKMLAHVNAPPVIGYLSIDVEGHELEVLAGMEFDRWTVELITIEHNLYCDGSERKELIYERLTRHGFERVVEDVVAPGYGPYEDWYARA